MTSSKRQARSDRRIATFTGTIGGVLTFCILRFSLMGGQPVPGYTRSLLFGEMPGWSSEWLLDLLFCCLGMTLSMYMYYRAMSRNPQQSVWRGRMTAGLGILVAVGGAGVWVGSIMGGWYSGIEDFFLVDGLLIVWASFLAIMFGLVIGIGRLTKLTYDRVWPPLRAAITAVCGLLAQACNRYWPRLRTTVFGRPFAKLNAYLQATDVPEDIDSR